MKGEITMSYIKKKIISLVPYSKKFQTSQDVFRYILSVDFSTASRNRLKNIINDITNDFVKHVKQYKDKSSSPITGKPLKSAFSYFLLILHKVRNSDALLEIGVKRIVPLLETTVNSTFVLARGTDFYSVDMLQYMEEHFRPFPNLQEKFKSVIGNSSNAVRYYKLSLLRNNLEAMKSLYSNLLSNNQNTAFSREEFVIRYLHHIFQILTVEPHYVEANTLLKRIALSPVFGGEFDKKIEYFLKQYSLAEELQYFLFGLSKVNNKLFKEAATDFRIASHLNKEYPEGYLLEALLTYVNQSPQKTIKRLQSVQRLFPDHPLINLNLTYMLYKTSQESESISENADLQRCLSLASNSISNFSALSTKAVMLALEEQPSIPLIIQTIDEASACPSYGPEDVLYTHKDKIAKNSRGYSDVQLIFNCYPFRKGENPRYLTFNDRAILQSIRLWTEYVLQENSHKNKDEYNAKLANKWFSFVGLIKQFEFQPQELSYALLILSARFINPPIDSIGSQHFLEPYILVLSELNGEFANNIIKIYNEFVPEHIQIPAKYLTQSFNLNSDSLSTTSKTSHFKFQPSFDVVDDFARNALHIAVIRQDIDELRTLLTSSQAKILNSPDAKGSYPCHYAMKLHSGEMLQLLGKEYCYHCHDQGDNTILHTAIQVGYPLNKLLDLIKDWQLMPLVLKRNYKGQTPLHLAIKAMKSDFYYQDSRSDLEKLTREFLESYPELKSYEDDQNLLPIHEGVIVGLNSLELDSLLPNEMSNEQIWNAIWLGVCHFKEEHPSKLLELFNTNTKAFRAMVSKPKVGDKTLIQWAVTESRVDFLEELVRNFGLDQKAATIAAIHTACTSGVKDVLSSFLALIPESRKLAYCQEQINDKVPILLAILNNNDEIVRYFLENKHLVNWSIEYTCKNSQKTMDLVCLAVRQNLNQELIKEIMKEVPPGRTISTTTEAESDEESSRCKGEASRALQKTPLHTAVIGNNLRSAENLISQEPHFISGRDNDSRTPLHYAINLKREDTLVKILVDRMGAWDLNTGDFDGQSALHYACIMGRLDYVKLIACKQGVLLTKKDKDGFAPIDHAASKGHVEIVRFLFRKTYDDLKKEDIKRLLRLIKDKGLKKEIENLLPKKETRFSTFFRSFSKRVFK